MPGGIEPPPTAADYLSLEEAVALLPPDVRIDKDGGTVAIQYLKDFLFTYNEASKITQRYERLHLLLQSGSEDAAQELYEKHLRKTLAGALQVDSFADFKRVWKELGDNHQEVSKRALEYALQAFHEQSAERNERVEKLTEFIRNKAEREKGVAVSDVVRPIKKLEGVPPAYEVPREQPFKKPDPQAATYGLRGLQEMKTSLEKRQNRVQQLEGQGGDPQVLTLARQELSNEQERLSIQEANRDRATGFEQRGSMFRLLEESFETKKSVGVLYADLAFLKYFDKVGGRQTGDLAILKAAEIFDQVRTRAGEGRKDVTIECYRLGGDEFAFAVSGDFQNKPEELEAVLQGMKRQLRQAAHEAGAIPSQAGAAPGYYDTELSISMGSHVYASEEQGIAECAANDLPLKPEEEAEGERLEKLQRNKLAETLVLVADKMVEIDKSFQRFLFLLDQRLRKNMASGKAKAALESQYAQLESYSQKAIFKEGKRKLDEWEERIKTDPETITELYKEILEYVTERVIAHARELQGESFDARRGVELLVRYRYLETREHELEQTITDLRQKLKQDDAKIEVLQLQLQQAEREQAVIRDLRGDIQKTASKAA
jgi:GGDEF domain-containing protein